MMDMEKENFNIDVQKLAKVGENTVMEYKSCLDEISHSVYESVCAMLNHNGGEILIGVLNDGTIEGVNPDKAIDLRNNLITTANNRSSFLPLPYIEPQILRVDGKVVIYLNIPCGQYVYRYNGRYWDRNGESDVDVTDSPELLQALFERKNPNIFEERFVDDLSVEDLDKQTFADVRRLVQTIQSDHSWLKMTDEELLRSCGLMVGDKLRYAALLLFGKDEAIERFLPRFRYELIFRMCTYRQYVNMDEHSNRYDDRVTLSCNLLKVYSELGRFVERHLPDKFYLPSGKSQRLNLKQELMREIVGNICVHPDFSSGYACFFEVYKDRVITRNPSRLIPMVSEGDVDIRELGNYTKNPLLVKVFRVLHYVEDLGSGTRNILQYAPLYYEKYKVEVLNGQNFVFSITYADDPENVGKTEEMSVKDVGKTEGMSVKNDGKGVSAKEKRNRRHQAIISLIRENADISQVKMASRLEVSTKTIERDLDELEKAGVVRYDGEKNSGQWVLIKEGK